MDSDAGGYNRPTNRIDNPLSAPHNRLAVMHDLGKHNQRYVGFFDIFMRDKQWRKKSGK